MIGALRIISNSRLSSRLSPNIGINTALVLSAISAADVTVVPSSLEAFGLVAQEATHCGSPSVVFNNTGLTTVIDHKKNGYVSKINSVDDMCHGINWCINEMNGKENYINLYSKEKFATERIIKSYLDFIND